MTYQSPSGKMHDIRRIAARVAARFLTRNGNLPHGFEGFDTERPGVVSPVEEAIREIRGKVGGLDEALSSHRLLKSPGISLLADPVIRYWDRRAWLVISKAPNVSGARAVGVKVQKNLKGKKTLSAADPYLHQLPLYVVAQDGKWVKIDPIPEKVKVKTGPDLNDQKRAVISKGEDYFGPGSIRITGGGSRGYTLAVTPKKPEHKKLFRMQTVKGSSLDDLSSRLDEAIGKIDQFLGR